MRGIARLEAVVLDCPDPLALAEFYSALIGWPLDHDGQTAGWVTLKGGEVDLAFQRVEDYTPPKWPGSSRPHQFHLDVQVDDLDTAEAQAVALGATRAEYQPGTTFRVLLDPAGHPFCLCIPHGTHQTSGNSAAL
ncbi:MAG TPA: VOC family protein [Actinopolymorphaceae bacterium]